MKKSRLFIILGAISTIAITGVVIFIIRKKKQKKIEEKGYDIVNTIQDTATGKTKMIIGKTDEFAVGDKVGIKSDAYKGKFNLYKVDNTPYSATALFIDTPYKGITRGLIWKE